MNLRVLVVDDSIAIREVLRQIVEGAGMEVVGEAASGVEAVELFRELSPELVLMDLVMPYMSGTEAALEILRIDPQARLIAISGLGQPSVMSEAQEVGMQGFVAKPFGPEELLQEIDLVLGRLRTTVPI